MSEYKKSGGFGGGNRGGYRNNKRSDFRPHGGDRGDRQMFSATCVACKSQCEVPFRPNGEKPVFCRDCFHKNENGQNNFAPKFERNQQDRFSTPKPAQFSPAPVADRRIDDIKRQVETINFKLDTLLRLMTEQHASALVIPEVSVVPAKNDKPAPKKKATSKKK